MSGYVYFIAPEAVYHRREERLQVVKIGHSKFNPISRMRNLQCGSPVTLELVAYIDGSTATERAFHEAFAPLRCHGEWFYLEYRLFNFLHYFVNYQVAEKDRYVSRERLCVSLYDNVFSDTVPHPDIPEEEYLSSADPSPLARLFPEAAL